MNSTDFFVYSNQALPAENYSFDDFHEDMPKAAVDQDEHGSNPKRLQVPKACSNCRKMHSGCGLERPCRRCVQNGLEATCNDIPRKKRASRKRSKSEKSAQPTVTNIQKNVSNELVTKATNFFNSPYGAVSSSTSSNNNDFSNLNINSLTDGAMMFDDPSVWEDTYKELFGDNSSSSSSSLSPQQSFIPPTSFPSDFSPLNDFQPQTLLITEMPSSLDDKSSSPSPNSIALGMPYTPGLSASMATSMPNPVAPVQTMSSPLPSVQLTPSSPLTSSTSGSSFDLSFLIQQITELRDSNKHLENRLSL